MKLFVDTNRDPSSIYSDPKNWNIVKNSNEFKSFINESIKNNEMPISISFDYDLENKSEGLSCLSDLIKTSIKLRINLPKIYLHCEDRNLAIDFENTLNTYTRKTNIPYTFEYTKKN